MKREGVERYLTYRLDSLTTEAIRMANEVYEKECGLSVRDLRILRLVDDNPGIIFSELVTEAKLERSLTSRILSKLIDDGLVRRKLGRSDARQFNLSTTTKGHATRDTASALGDAMERHLLQPLNNKEKELLFTCLRKLTAWVYGDAKRDWNKVVELAGIHATRRP
jgi:DNA-binding MarR family transcriptional regulator